MTDYKASQFNQTIASKSTIVPSDHQLEYNAGDTIKFDVPAFMGFIDPRQSYLKMNVKVDSALPVRFSKTCGVQSIINNLRIYDGTQTHQIENLENYAERVEKEYHYSANPSVVRKRQLTEGVEPNSTSFNFPEAQLFTSYPAILPFDKNTSNDPNSVAGQPYLTCENTIEVCLPLSSGVLGGNKIFPSALTQGLKIEIDTNDAKKALEVWDLAGLGVEPGIAVGSNVGSASQYHFGIEAKVGGVFAQGAGTPLTRVDLFSDNSYKSNSTAGFNGASSAPWKLAQLRAGQAPTREQIFAEMANVRNVKNLSSGATNLIIGQHLFGTDTAGLTRNFGRIDRIQYQTLAGGLRVYLDGSYSPADANGVPGILGTSALVGDFIPGICWCGGNGVGGAYEELLTAGYCNYRLNDIELVLKTAQPPKSYVDKLMKQTMSEDGAEVDIKTYQTMRNNIQAGDRMSQINLPSYNERAVGIYCLPMDNGVGNSLGVNNLETTLDTLENYQFIVNGTGQPTRRVDTKPYTNSPPTTAQVALWETEKTLSSSKVIVRNLREPHKNFMVARALARYGGVYDLKADGSISLKQEYSNPTKNKLMISFIGHLRRIVVSRMGMSVEL